MQVWLRHFLTWDGILPLAVSAVPVTVALLLPRNDVAEVSAVLLVPMFAALVRTGIGVRQIRSLCDGRLPAARQLALAAAIVLLLLFEGLVSLLSFADDEPASAWAFPLAFYLGYLAAIALAFAPRPMEWPRWVRRGRRTHLTG